MGYTDTIGARAYQECLRLWGSVGEATKIMGVSHKTIIYRWGKGETCPQAYFLAQMCEAGADIKYILIGEKSNELP